MNVGYAPQDFATSQALLHSFRNQIASEPHMSVAESVDDVDRIGSAGDVAIVFDLEDSAPLDGDLENLRVLVGQGVRTLAPTYNYANAAGCGCLDVDDGGLTRWGRQLVREMNAVGVVPDGSHGSVKTGIEMCALSERPVIYSHSCMRSVWDHPRNITDDQARACADTGGVVGITGVGIFLGPNTPTLEAMAAHLEYAVDLIGIEHIGVSSDYSFDFVDFRAEIAANPALFDGSYTRWGPIEWMPPERLLGLGAHLEQRGWTTDNVAAVIGGNFRRVADQSWIPG